MSVRRWCVAGSVLALSAGLALQPVVSSAKIAGVIGAQVVTDDFWGDSSTGSGPCTGTDATGATPTLDLPVNGGWRTVSMQRTGGVVATSQTSSTSKVSGRVSTTARGGTRLDLSVRAAARATPTSVSPTCTVRYDGRGGGGVETTVSRRSWMVARSTVTAQGAHGGDVMLQALDGSYFAGTTPGKPLTRLVAPGSYLLFAIVDAKTEVPAGSTTARSASATMTASMSAIPIGTRRTLTGTGRPYVVAGHRDCARSRVAVALTRAARTKVRSIAFFVDGQRRVVLRGRGLQRSSLLLTRLAPRKFGVVRADVVLRSGAKRVMRSTSWPCA